jgi:hypothetical protein
VLEAVVRSAARFASYVTDLDAEVQKLLLDGPAISRVRTSGLATAMWRKK